VPSRTVVCIALALVVVVVAGVVGPVEPAAALTPPGAAWRPPIDGPVLRGFAPPARAFGPEHLGVDYRAAAGTAVHAAGPGVVAFAGVIAGAVHVVVAHDGNLRTSYSFLASASVHRGQHVDPGTVLGRAGGNGENHSGVVHFGLRVGDTYVDPLVLFRSPDLTKVVHLAPHRDPVLDSVGNERRGLLAGLTSGLRAIAGVVANVDTRLARLTQHEMQAAMQLAVHGSVVELSNFLDHLSVLPTLQDDMRVAQRLVAWARSLGVCDPHPPPANGTGGSGNRVLAVAGINSSMHLGERSLELPLDRLGYAPVDTAYFSYSDTGGDYDAADTHEPIEAAARQLGDQLRMMQRAEPGKPVDLIAHSQGGIVVLAFLLLDYRPDDPTLPPLGNVVTLSSPIHGAPGASLLSLIAQTATGRELLARLGAPTGASVRELEEDSSFLRKVDGARLPDQIDLTTIGDSNDYVVPGSTAHRAGGSGFDIDAPALEPHTEMLNDDRTLRAVRAALEHRALPCQTFAEALDAATVPTAITRLEHLGPLAPLARRP
jgi:murein DD-endopeptidase MepM/ murein hydrolase activator NlpD